MNNLVEQVKLRLAAPDIISKGKRRRALLKQPQQVQGHWHREACGRHRK
jgi:hypothetical protein